MDVVVWLRSLGLGKYEAIFRENDIDETVLPSLTHENLKELGVASLGHRVKLLDAIATLRSDSGGKTPFVDATASGAPSVPAEDTAVNSSTLSLPYKQMRTPRLHPVMQKTLSARRPSPLKIAPSAGKSR